MTVSSKTFGEESRAVLAIDPGGRRMGLARVGPSGLVQPTGVWAYRGLRTTARLLRDEMQRIGAGVCVIGLPTNVDGEETGACRRSRALGAAMEELGLKVSYQEEYLSSHEARRRAREIGRKSTEAIDDLAAVVILEDYLERLKRSGNQENPDAFS